MNEYGKLKELGVVQQRTITLPGQPSNEDQTLPGEAGVDEKLTILRRQIAQIIAQNKNDISQ